MPWSIWIDESGQFHPNDPLSIVSALIHPREAFVGFQAFRRDLDRALPLWEWPPHASEDNWLARRADELRRTPRVAATAEERAFWSLLEPAVEHLSTAPDRHFRRIREGKAGQHDWIQAERILTSRYRPAEKAIKAQRRASQQILGEFARQCSGEGGVVVAAADGAAAGEDAYVHALEACFRRLNALHLGGDVRITVASRSLSGVGVFGGVWLKERLHEWGLPPLWVKQAAAIPYHSDVPVPMAFADIVANRVRAGLGATNPRTDWRLSKVEAAIRESGALGLPAPLTLRHRGVIPMLTSVRAEAAIASGSLAGLPVGWERDQAEILLERRGGAR